MVPRPSVLLSLRVPIVQYFADSREQGFRRVGFRQEVFDSATRRFGRAAIRIQTARRNDFYRGIDSRQGLNRGRAVHDRHHHIGENDGDFILVLNVNGEGVRSIRCGHNPVAKGL